MTRQILHNMCWPRQARAWAQSSQKSMGRSSLTGLDLNSILLLAEREGQWDKKSCMSDIVWENICAWCIRRFVTFSAASIQLCVHHSSQGIDIIWVRLHLCLLFISSMNILLTYLRSLTSLFYAPALLSPLFKIVWYWQMLQWDSYLLQIYLSCSCSHSLFDFSATLLFSLDLVCLLLSMFLPQTESCFFTMWELTRLVMNWRKGSLIADGRDHTEAWWYVWKMHTVQW